MVGTKLAPPVGSGAKLTTRLLAALMALMLCVGLMPAVPAWADEGAGDGTETTTAVLTVVAGSQTDGNTHETTYDTWVNKAYEFGEGATVKDLLDAAVAAGDLGGYASSESSYGLSLDGITSASGIEQKTTYGSSTSVYWALFVDGDYASQGFADTKLEGGHSYQLAWTSYVSFSTPSTVDEWKAYYGDVSLDDDTEMANDTAVLTVVAGSQTDWNTYETTYETTYDTWVNKAYKLEDMAASFKKEAADLTISDLLAYAVGQGDLGSINTSESQHGTSLDGITSAEGVFQSVDYGAPGGSLYWSIYERCVSSNVGIDAKIEGNASYQIAWTFYSSVNTPSTSAAWDSYYEKNVPTKGEFIAVPSTPVDRPQDQYTPTGVDSSQLGNLAKNVAASYAGLNYASTTDAWKYMELAALGQAGSVDKEAFLSAALSEMKSADTSASGYTTRSQRNIIALTALGYDATALPDGDGVYDAVEAMAQDVSSSSFNNVLIFTLIAYACGDYEVPEDAVLSESALVSTVLAKQFSNGGFAFNNDSASVDMTSYAVNALSSYQGDYPQVVNAVNKALVFLKDAQCSDGGFGYYASDEESNVYSTATAIVALCAVEIDPAASWAVESGQTPMSALLSFAATDLSGFVDDDELGDMATEQGLRALVVYQGLKNTGAAYNIYTQAAKGQAAFSSNPAPADDGTAPVLAQTGDEAPLTAGVASAAVLGAIACVIAARRKLAPCDATDVVITR